MRNVVAIILLVFCVSACQNKKEALQPVKFKYKTVDMKSNAKDETGPFFEIKANVAYAAEGTNAQRVNDSLLNILSIMPDESLRTLPESIDTVAMKMVRSFESEFNRSINYHAYYNIDTKVENTSDTTVAYVANITCYLGGAHDSHVNFYCNFNTYTGEVITLDDIFNEGYRKPLIGMTINRLAKELGVVGLEGLRELNVFEMMEPDLARNYLIGKDTITFHYNEYEIAPYSMGTFDVKFSRDELKSLLKGKPDNNKNK